MVLGGTEFLSWEPQVHVTPGDYHAKLCLGNVDVKVPLVLKKCSTIQPRASYNAGRGCDNVPRYAVGPIDCFGGQLGRREAPCLLTGTDEDDEFEKDTDENSLNPGSKDENDDMGDGPSG